MSAWIPGQKPLKKIVDDGGEKYIGVALTRLRDLYRQGAPVLQSLMLLDEATILVQKMVMIDIITITVQPGGYVVSAVYRILDGDAPAFGRAYFMFGQVVYQSSKLDAAWKKVGAARLAHQVAPIERGRDPAEVINANLTYGRALDPATINFYLQGLGGTIDEHALLPFKGKLLHARRVQNQSVDVVYNDVTPPYLSAVFLSDNALRSVTEEVDYRDIESFNGLGHQFQPVVLKGERCIFFTYHPDLGTTNLVFYRTESKETSITLVSTTPEGWFMPRPALVNLMPNTVFGYQNFQATLPATKPAFYFVSHDAGQTIRRLGSSPFIDAVNASLENVISAISVSLIALGAATVLLVGPAPVPFITFDSRQIHFYRITISGDGVIETLVLALPGIKTGLQVLVMGGGCVLVMTANQYIPGSEESGYRPRRWISLDNGRTFTESAAALPGVAIREGFGLNGLLGFSIARTIFVASPYVNEENQGVLFMATDIWQPEAFTSNRGDTAMFRSTDLGASWDLLKTIGKADNAPLNRRLSGVAGVSYSARLADSIQIVAPGTKASPLPIDPIHPYRCDDTYPVPAEWLEG